MKIKKESNKVITLEIPIEVWRFHRFKETLLELVVLVSEQINLSTNKLVEFEREMSKDDYLEK